MISKIRLILVQLIFSFVFLPLKIDKKKIVFCSYYGKQYSDNPKYLSELISKDGTFNTVWLINSKHQDLPSYVTQVKYNSIRAIYELSTAAYWVDNSRKYLGLLKKKKQKYIQCWHGTPLKKIEFDADRKLSWAYRINMKIDSQKIDYLLVGNRFCENIFPRAFNYKSNIIAYGTPRNDILFYNNTIIKEKVEKKLKFSNKRIILFAPTFRNCIQENGMAQIEQLNPVMLFNTLKKRYKEECVLIIRFHSNISSIIDWKSLKQKMQGICCIDGSQYEDMQELLCAADVLITDYSSSFIDFSLTHRQIFLFQPDYEEYLHERGLYSFMKELPFPTSYSANELNSQIIENTEKDAERQCKIFLDYVGNYERGDACKNIMEAILKND